MRITVDYEDLLRCFVLQQQPTAGVLSSGLLDWLLSLSARFRRHWLSRMNLRGHRRRVIRNGRSVEVDPAIGDCLPAESSHYSACGLLSASASVRAADPACLNVPGGTATLLVADCILTAFRRFSEVRTVCFGSDGSGGSDRVSALAAIAQRRRAVRDAFSWL